MQRRWNTHGDMWQQRLREFGERLGFPRKHREAESLGAHFEDPNLHPQTISIASFALPELAAKAFKSRGTYPLPLGEVTWENPWTGLGAEMIRGELMGIRGRTAVVRERLQSDPALTFFLLVDMRGLAEGCEAEIKSQWRAYRRGEIEFSPPVRGARGTARFIPAPVLYGQLPEEVEDERAARDAS